METAKAEKELRSEIYVTWSAQTKTKADHVSADYALELKANKKELDETLFSPEERKLRAESDMRG